MSGDTETGAAGWHDDEVGSAGLPDKRLARRLRRLLDQMSSAPGLPVPAACGDWAATKAAYRFFDNPRVTKHGVLAGHFAATAARVAASEGPILILQDTTEFIYSRARPGKIGFTKTINAGHYKAGQPNVVTLCGVLMHSSLAVTLNGTPLGLPAQAGEGISDPSGTVRPALYELGIAREVPAYPRCPAVDGADHPRALDEWRSLGDDHAGKRGG